jgi:hypothetical protein
MSTYTFNGQDGSTVFGQVATELHPMLDILLAETERRGYKIQQSKGCWGYANRNISGTNIPSNHSRGAAIDINANENGFGDQTPAFPAKIAHEVWEPVGWEWGGDWSGSGKDGMHMEYLPARSTVKKNTDKAKRLFGQLEEDDLTPEQEQFLKTLMNQLGGTPKGAAERLASVAPDPEPQPDK